MKRVRQGGSTEVTSIKQAEEILSSTKSGSTAPVRVVGYFKNGFEDAAYKAFNRRKYTILSLLDR